MSNWVDPHLAATARAVVRRAVTNRLANPGVKPNTSGNSRPYAGRPLAGKQGGGSGLVSSALGSTEPRLLLELARMLLTRHRGEAIDLLLGRAPQLLAGFRGSDQLGILRDQLLGSTGASERVARSDARSQARPFATDVLEGQAASSGSVRATARIVHDRDGLRRIRSGEIVVATAFRAEWEAELSNAGGLVLETGGMAAPGFRLARSRRLPAVRLPGATDFLTDGETIMVDGSGGLVHRT